jgi:hypothetical protein
MGLILGQFTIKETGKISGVELGTEGSCGNCLRGDAPLPRFSASQGSPDFPKLRGRAVPSASFPFRPSLVWEIFEIFAFRAFRHIVTFQR